jgi:ribonuclease PH
VVRIDGRAYDEIRPVRLIPGFQNYAEGSVLIEQGQTRVVCSVSVEDRVPGFLKGQGTGWLTAEYSMLPRSTLTRTSRTGFDGKVAGRSQEIQRLIGRSLRACVDLQSIGERTFTVDCDVIQADGGTRTASITGAYVALNLAFNRLKKAGIMPRAPLKTAIAAISVGVVNGRQMIDLCYDEDSHAEMDFNVVMNERGEFVELQATAETKTFSRETLDSLVTLADRGIHQLFDIQKAALGGVR